MNAQVGREIGAGASGVVFTGKFRHSTVAVKKLRANKNNKKAIEREIEILSKVNHTNIVRFLAFGYLDDGAR
jgi:serine/threonine protein kinase